MELGCFFFFQAEDGIRDADVTGVQTCALPILSVDEQAEEHGPALWERNPDQCCSIRKVQPLRRFLADKQAWITGIRRSQTARSEERRVGKERRARWSPYE